MNVESQSSALPESTDAWLESFLVSNISPAAMKLAISCGRQYHSTLSNLNDEYARLQSLYTSMSDSKVLGLKVTSVVQSSEAPRSVGCIQEDTMSMASSSGPLAGSIPIQPPLVGISPWFVLPGITPLLRALTPTSGFTNIPSWPNNSGGLLGRYATPSFPLNSRRRDEFQDLDQVLRLMTKNMRMQRMANKQFMHAVQNVLPVVGTVKLVLLLYPRFLLPFDFLPILR